MTRVDTLHIGEGLELDADFVASATLAILAKRGAGKTYAGRVLTEELHAASTQTVVVDPTGAWWGLRSSADGESEGLPLPIFGGRHGDAPLESTAGRLMADLVVGEGLSMILDLSEFASRAQELQFAADFFDRLFRRNRELVHLAIDEADMFAPQVPRSKDDARVLATVENIVRRGRNRGLGITLISQRSAVLNKNVLSQVDGLVALRTPASQDRDAIRAWVQGQGDSDRWMEVAPSLPSLANGESWWWIPEKGILQRVQVRKSHTFDSSPNRRRAQRRREPKTFADVDLNAISGRIAATLERAKTNDPRELRLRIQELEQQLAAAQAATPAPAPVEVLDPASLARLEAAIAQVGQPGTELTEAGEKFAGQVGELLARLTATAQEITSAAGEVQATLRRHTATATGGSAPQNPRPATARRSTPAQSQPAISPAAAADASRHDLPPARQRIINAAAALERIGLSHTSKTQLALWVGVSPKSSGYQNNLGALRSLGLVHYPQPGHVALTAAGRNLADMSVADTLITTEALHAHVRNLLTPARWLIVDALIEAYPRSLAKVDLAGQIGVSAASSGYQNNLGALRSLGLVDYPQPGHVVATNVLFLDRQG